MFFISGISLLAVITTLLPFLLLSLSPSGFCSWRLLVAGAFSLSWLGLYVFLLLSVPTTPVGLYGPVPLFSLLVSAWLFHYFFIYICLAITALFIFIYCRFLL